MALFGTGNKNEPERITEPVDPNWVRTATGAFLPLLSLDPEEQGLGGVGGVYLIWHGGVRPEWVYVGHDNNLASALHQAGNDPDIGYFEKNGGLFVAWAPVIAKYRPGVVKYIEQTFKTQIRNKGDFDDQTVPVPVIAPVIEKSR